MAQLHWKTRGDSTPKGKPRVYFACHREDFQGHFDEITAELLKISNCAIYYYEEEPALDEEYYLNLEQMQLVVMPVTSRLLYMPSRAMDVEFPYAMEHHIPVLPLMQEQGLAQRFNEKFGDLQFLDKHDTDPTAIPYEEKLKKYLEAVLVDDDLARKVREAFDAYIFLSYRKKDRKYAQELMRLIHRSEFCRDIAIWYDEFLTPGENFNEAIREAMEKSRLFVLAVTPNLVNESNYVMNVEYPMAKEAGMPILPAQMSETDARALRRCYDGIPGCVNPRSKWRMDGALMKSLRRLALRENDGDPQHNFFIGLAYLSGIDVEVDHQRAVKLITGSAEAGLTEAMEKLVSMYENGEGVKRDYRTATLWREKLAKQAQRQYEKSKTTDNARNYFYRLWDWGNGLMGQSDLPAAKKVYTTMYQFSEKLAQQSGDPWARKHLAVAGHFLGAISVKEGDLKKAEQWFRECIRIDLELVDSGFDAAKRDLSDAYDWMGRICMQQQDLKGAKSWFTKELELEEQLAQIESEKMLRPLSAAYARMGDLCQENMELGDARKWYTKALETAEKQAGIDPEGAQKGLIFMYHNLGRLCRLEGDLAGARQWFTKCLEAADKRAQTEKVEAMRDLAIVSRDLGTLNQDEEKYSEARQWFRLSRSVQEKLAKTGTVEALSDLAGTYISLGHLASCENDLRDARYWYEKALELHQKLAETGTVKGKHDLSVSYEKLGDLCRDEGKLDQAKQWYTKSLEIREELAESGTWDSLDGLAFSYTKLGILADQEKDYQEAYRWYVLAKKSREKLAANGTPNARQELSNVYHRLSNLCRNWGDREKAKMWLKYSIDMEEALVREGFRQAEPSLCVSYADLGYLCMQDRDFDAAKQWVNKGIPGLEKQAQSGTPDAQRDLMIGYLRMGEIYYEMDDPWKAEPWLMKTLGICTKLAESKTVESRWDLGFIYNKLGLNSSAKDEVKQALQWFQKALVVREKLEKETGTLSSSADCAMTMLGMGLTSGDQEMLIRARDKYQALLKIRPGMSSWKQNMNLASEYIKNP